MGTDVGTPLDGAPRLAEPRLAGLAAVTAAIDPAGPTASVLRAARALGERLQLPLRLLHVTGTATGRRWAEEVAAQTALVVAVEAGEPAAVVARRAAGPHDDLLVLGLRGAWDDPRGPGHVTCAALLAARRPVVLVPSEVPSGGGFERVLVGIDDVPATSAALAPVVADLEGAGCTVVSAHVVDRTATPGALDHDGREARAWHEEFASRHRTTGPIVLRRGDPARCLLELADPATTDLLVLAWRGRLDVGDAGTLQEVLRRVQVPTLVLPVAAAADPQVVS